MVQPPVVNMWSDEVGAGLRAWLPDSAPSATPTARLIRLRQERLAGNNPAAIWASLREQIRAQTYYAQVNPIFTGASNAAPEPPWEYRPNLDLHEDA